MKLSRLMTAAGFNDVIDYFDLRTQVGDAKIHAAEYEDETKDKHNRWH